jgi:hypothetical protein
MAVPLPAEAVPPPSPDSATQSQASTAQAAPSSQSTPPLELAAPSVDPAISLAATLAKLVPGQVLQAEVRGRDGEGRAVVATQAGDFVVDPTRALPDEAPAELLIVRADKQIAALVIKRDGVPLDAPPPVTLTLVRLRADLGAPPPQTAEPVNLDAPDAPLKLATQLGQALLPAKALVETLKPLETKALQSVAPIPGEARAPPPLLAAPMPRGIGPQAPVVREIVAVPQTVPPRAAKPMGVAIVTIPASVPSAAPGPKPLAQLPIAQGLLAPPAQLAQAAARPLEAGIVQLVVSTEQPDQSLPNVIRASVLEVAAPGEAAALMDSPAGTPVRALLQSGRLLIATVTLPPPQPSAAVPAEPQPTGLPIATGPLLLRVQPPAPNLPALLVEAPKLAHAQPLAEGSRVLLLVADADPPVTLVPARAPVFATPLPTAPNWPLPEALAAEWPEVAGLMATAQAAPQAQAFAQRLPAPSPQLPAVLTFFMAVAGVKPAMHWMGPTATRALEELAGPAKLKVLERLVGRDASQPATPAASEARTYLVPLQADQSVTPMLLTLHPPGHMQLHRDNSSQQQAADDQGFSVKVRFEGVGPLELSGVANARRLDIDVRTLTPLPRTLRDSTVQVFRAALETYGLGGSLGFGRLATARE